MRWMKAGILGVSLAMAAVASAQNRDVDRAVQRQFPGAKAQTVAERTVNNVRIYDLRIRGDRGDSTATVSEFGDFISTSTPVSGDRVPRQVTDLLTSMSRADSRDVEQSEQTYYLIDIGEGQKAVRLEVDAAGRLHQILSIRAARQAESLEGYERASEREGADARQELEKYFSNPRMGEVYRHPDADGFLVARLTADPGQTRITVIFDPRNGEFSEWRTEIDARDIPRPVRDSVSALYRDAAIHRAERNVVDSYRTRLTLGDDTPVLRIRPTGEVLSVRSERSAQDEAKTAWDRIDPDPNLTPNRDRDRDRDNTPRPDTDRRDPIQREIDRRLPLRLDSPRNDQNRNDPK